MESEEFTPEEAAAALRETERAQSSIRNVQAKPWFYPSLALVAAAMTVGMLMLGTAGFVVVLVAVTGLTMLNRRHDEAVGVKEKGLNMRAPEIVVLALAIIVYVAGGIAFTQYGQAWGVPVAAVSLAVGILGVGLIRRARR